MKLDFSVMNVGRLHQKTFPIFEQNNNGRPVPHDSSSLFNFQAPHWCCDADYEVITEADELLQKVIASLNSFYGFRNISFFL